MSIEKRENGKNLPHLAAGLSVKRGGLGLVSDCAGKVPWRLHGNYESFSSRFGRKAGEATAFLPGQGIDNSEKMC